MKIKLSALLLCFFMCAGIACSNEVMKHKVSAKQAASSLPGFNNASCKFQQQKTVKNASSSVTLKSGGNFEFVKSNGVVFETTYPVHSVSSYTSSQNKQVSSIIKAISEKNYTYLEKNFDIYYLKKSLGWELAFTPKAGSKTASQMKKIYIKGVKHIDYMDIETMNSKTSIQFTECR